MEKVNKTKFSNSADIWKCKQKLCAAGQLLFENVNKTLNQNLFLIERSEQINSIFQAGHEAKSAVD